MAGMSSWELGWIDWWIDGLNDVEILMLLLISGCWWIISWSLLDCYGFW
jgi:hypothetical protein